jgi:hypothetical protein
VAALLHSAFFLLPFPRSRHFTNGDAKFELIISSSASISSMELLIEKANHAESSAITASNV